MSVTFAPQSNIILCHVPFAGSVNHNLYFKPTSSKTSAQLRDEYFEGLKDKQIFDRYTYVRKDNSIKIYLNYELAKNYNYCYYQNYQATGYNKTYYCYIVKHEYVNENCTRIYIQTDSWQTYFEDVLKDTTSMSYIDRAHVSKSDDVIGRYLEPEGLEHGEYLVGGLCDESNLDIFPSDLKQQIEATVEIKTKDGTTETVGDTVNVRLKGMIVIGFSTPIRSPSGDANSIFGYTDILGGSYTGLRYVAFANTTMATRFLRYADSLAQGDAIYTMFMVPYSITSWTRFNLPEFISIDNEDHQSVAQYGPLFWYVPNTVIVKEFTQIAGSVGTFVSFKYKKSDGSYTPHNNKLYTGEYNNLLLTDLNGHAGTYFFEDFKDGTHCSFDIKGVISQGCSIVAVPQSYKGTSGDNYNECLQLVKLPTCAWTTDTYTNWLTQTAVSRQTELNYAKDKYNIKNTRIAKDALVDTANSIFGGGGDGETFNPNIIQAVIGAADAVATAAIDYYENETDYAKKVADINNEVYEHSLIPNKAQNTAATPDVMFALGKSNFCLYNMKITGEYAKKIDNFLDRYGYSLAREGKLTDYISTRSKWNYIKCVECNIKNNSIPDENLREIKQLFEGGVTLWHNADNIFRYDLGSSNT